jgi:hypothetical protein
MTTTIVSDLHLGARMSLLAVPAARRRLIAELADVDRLVLLGDVLALRDGPALNVLEAARPLLEELAEALEGRQVVIVPGNHDHQLAVPLLERRRLDEDGDDLAVEWVVEPGASGLLDWIVAALRGVEVVVAYPGVWIRPDVYATHGHYLDCHMTVPRVECVLAGLMKAVTGGPPESGALPQDYEATVAPIYAFAYAAAQSAAGRDEGQSFGAGLWRRLKAHGHEHVRGATGRASTLVGGALAVAAVAALNRSGFGAFRADLSPAELGRAGVRAMVEVVRRLDVEANHVLFGHTHRPGPLDGEVPWALPGGASLVNTGSWVYSPALVGDAGERGPYSPGTCAVVHDNGPPELRRVLGGVSPSPATP